jgi:molybdate transport system substrate-binding protein
MTAAGWSGGGWQVRVRVWVEREGRSVLGEGQLELLECIGRCGSISAAAREVGVSYRHAWVTVREVNAAAGEPLVTASTGGRRGGGASLTERGALAVSLCRGLQQQFQQAAPGLAPHLLGQEGPSVLHVAAAVSLAEVLGALATDFARQPGGVRVRVLLGASDELAELLLAGAAVDVFLTAQAGLLDGLAARDVVCAETARPLAENTLTAIGREGLSGSLRRPAGLLGPAVGRVALAAPSCPLGGYTRSYLEGLGLYEPLLRRAVLVDHAHAVAAAVRSGQADAGLVYATEAPGAGCRVLFRVPHPPAPVRYAGVVLRHARRPAEARRFLEFLASPPAARRFRRWGFRAPR